MKSFFKSLLIILTLFTFLGFSTATPVSAQTSEWSSSLCVGPESMGAGDVATIQGLECLIANILTVTLTVIGLSGFVMTVYASFQWMISGGNTKGTELAKNTMTYAVVGLVVALSSFIIINMIAAFTGISVITQFRIPTPQWEYQ